MIAIPVSGLAFPEGPRWRNGHWYLSDQLGGRILRLDEAGQVETVAELEAPSGLGFDPDGRLMVATMSSPSLRVVERDGTTQLLVDLAETAGHLNDMFVDEQGRAYIDAYDDPFDVDTHKLLLVDPAAEGEKRVRVAAKGMGFPNGITTTTDGQTLLVSETFGGHVTAFDVAADGSLDDRRVWAKLPDDRRPDGLCLDANGDLWVATYTTGEFFHIREGGEVIDRIEFPGRWALSCSLGGADGRSLLTCTAETTQEDYFAGRAVGHLDIHRVEIPGVGRP